MNIRERSRELGKALTRYVHARLQAGQLQAGDRLPAERELAEMFGGSRGAIRRALLEMENEGLIGREVGRGTFIKAAAMLRPSSMPPGREPEASALTTFEQVVRLASPSDAFELRLAVEPAMLEQVALRASSSDLADMTHCLEQGRLAVSVEDLEHWDNRLHRTMAAATRNPMFVAAYEIISAVRLGAEWGALRRRAFTEVLRRRSYDDHAAIIQALRDRDAGTARAILTDHLQRWRDLSFRPGVEADAARVREETA